MTIYIVDPSSGTTMPINCHKYLVVYVIINVVFNCIYKYCLSCFAGTFWLVRFFGLGGANLICSFGLILDGPHRLGIFKYV